MSWQLAHHPPGHFGERAVLIWALRGVALLLLIGGVVFLHSLVNDVSKGPNLQRIKLVGANAPPPPPPPPPEEKPPEPDQRVKQELTAIDEQFAAPGPKGEAGALGVDAEGDPGSDDFGLAAKPGGRELTTYPEGSGYGLGAGAGGGGGVAAAVERFNVAMGRAYERRLGLRLEDLLSRRDDLRRAAWQARVAVWVDARGLIARAEVRELDGAAALSPQLVSALTGVDTDEAPPPRYPLPVTIVVTSRLGAK